VKTELKNALEYLKKRKKNILKYSMIIVVLLLAVYAFWDSLEDALAEMKRISANQIFLILILACVYQILDGANITMLASNGKNKLKLLKGEYCMLLASFFRVITFGSGAGVATIAFLVKEKYPVSEATGISAINYMLHKVMIALFCVGLMILRFPVIRAQYGSYFQYLVLSMALVTVIVLFYLFMCTSRKFHKIILSVVSLFNKKGRHDKWVSETSSQFEDLEIYSTQLLGNKKRIAVILLFDLLKFISWYSIPFVLLHGSVEISYIDCLTRMAFAIAIAGVLPSPAGIGSTEFAFLLLFAQIAIQKTLLSTVLLYRSATFVFIGLLGGIVLFCVYITKIIYNRRHPFS